MSGYIRNNKKRILNDCRSRIRFHFRTIRCTARCWHGYRSILCCERPPIPDHHPWVPRRSIRSARDEWLNHYHEPLPTINVFLFSLFHFFLSNILYWLTFCYLYILLLIIYIVTWIHLCLFWKFKAYFFDLCLIHFDSCLFYFWKTDKRPPDGNFKSPITYISCQRLSRFQWHLQNLVPVKSSKPLTR